MGYRGKVAAQDEARRMRAEGECVIDIARALGVAKSSVSLWVRDVEFEARPRRGARRREPNALQRRKQAEIDAMIAEGRHQIGALSEREFLVAGAALYAGEGSKRDGCVKFANSDPRMMAFFATWLRHFFSIDESRLRVVVYLHEGLDLEEAEATWAQFTGVPRKQFTKAYRAAPNASIRTTKHAHGCAYLVYSCSRTHRAIMGLVTALLTSHAAIRGSSMAEQGAVNAKVESSSLSPGAEG
jgi:hypothetical protein